MSYPSSDENVNISSKEKSQHNENIDGDGGHRDLHGLSLAHMTPEERAATLKLANEADPGPATFSLAYARFFFMCMVVIVCSCDTGFDTTIMSSVNSMTQFQGYFGLVSASTGTGILFVS